MSEETQSEVQDESSEVDSLMAETSALKAETSALREELSALKSAESARTATALVDDAVNSGKITPAQRAWAESYAGRDPAGFREFVATSAAVIETGEIAGGRATESIPQVQAEVNSMLGISSDTFSRLTKK